MGTSPGLCRALLRGHLLSVSCFTDCEWFSYYLTTLFNYIDHTSSNGIMAEKKRPLPILKHCPTMSGGTKKTTINLGQGSRSASNPGQLNRDVWSTLCSVWQPVACPEPIHTASLRLQQCHRKRGNTACTGISSHSLTQVFFNIYVPCIVPRVTCAYLLSMYRAHMARRSHKIGQPFRWRTFYR